MLKSRVEMEREPRTMQFLMERQCPAIVARGGRELKFHAAVDVLFEAPIPHGICGAPSFAVVGSIAIDENGGTHKIYPALDNGGKIRVCEHMGRLIE